MTETDEYRYDFFISYSHVDREWVRGWLLPALEDSGLRGCVDFRDFKIGATTLANMENAVKGSRHTIIVLTPEWVQSEWAGFEAMLAQAADPANRKGILIPILLRSCEIPLSIQTKTYANFRNQADRDNQLQRVIAAVRDERSQAGTIATPPAETFNQTSTQNSDPDDPLSSLKNRLVGLSKREKLPFVCIGSVYLDIIIHDIKTDKDHRHFLDFSREVPVNLDIEPGGSVYYVAKYLNKYDRQPLVVSYVGDGSINGFADTFFKRADRDKIGVAVQTVERQKGAATAVTIHFVDSERPGTAMYTDRGLLRHFGWRQAFEILQGHARKHKQPYDDGVIYIAGFFKTSLHDHLHENLRELRQNGSVIFLDHGRLEPDEGIEAETRIRNLAEALQMVDVYFSTKEELAQLASEIARLGLTGRPLQNTDSFPELVDQIAQDGGIDLPPIMLIKDRTGRPRIHKVGMRTSPAGYEWRDIRVPGRTITRRRYIVGSSNAFNAAFMDAFLRIGDRIDLDTIAGCAEHAQLQMVKAETEG